MYERVRPRGPEGRSRLAQVAAKSNDFKRVAEGSRTQDVSDVAHAATHLQKVCRGRQSGFPNSPTHKLTNLPLGLIFGRPDAVFGSRDRVVRKPLVVDAVAIGIADLLILGPVAFDRALVIVGIVGPRGVRDRVRSHTGAPVRDCRSGSAAEFV